MRLTVKRADKVLGRKRKKYVIEKEGEDAERHKKERQCR